MKVWLTRYNEVVVCKATHRKEPNVKDIINVWLTL